MSGPSNIPTKESNHQGNQVLTHQQGRRNKNKRPKRTTKQILLLTKETKRQKLILQDNTKRPPRRTRRLLRQRKTQTKLRPMIHYQNLWGITRSTKLSRRRNQVLPPNRPRVEMIACAPRISLTLKCSLN